MKKRMKVPVTALAYVCSLMALMAAKFPNGEAWGRRFAVPEGFVFERKADRVKSEDMGGFTLETWRQANGPNSFQSVLVTVPKGVRGKLPAVVVTLENSESMFEVKPQDGVTFASDLAKRGYVTVSSNCGLSDKSLSGWFGMGRLAHNARLLVDFAAMDGRVDKERIGMAGAHEGGKIAYYAGLLDVRVKAVGVGFLDAALTHPSWSETRFWGDATKTMLEEKLSNRDILVQSGGKPVFFLRGRGNEDAKGDSGFFMAALDENAKSRVGCVRRYSRTNRMPRKVDVDELYVFLDDYVKNVDNLPKAYQGGRVRLFKRGDRVEGKVSRFVRIPAVAVAPDGSVVVVFDARICHYGDLFECQPMLTVVMRSTDCGKTWSEPKFLWNPPWNEDERFAAGDPSLLVDKVAGKVFCFANVMEYARGRNVYRFFVWESSDNGINWSGPREITDDIRWPGVVPGRHSSFIVSGHGIQRKDGVLMHVILSQRFGVNVFGSEDHGRTWKCFGNPTHGVTDESKIEVLSDGTWMINSRAEMGNRRVYRSKDCGKTWKGVVDTNLIDALCNGATLTVPLKDGSEALLFSNTSRAVRPRMYITLSASLDGGNSWNRGVVIDPGPCEYSDCAYMSDGRVAVVYEAPGAIDFVAVPMKEVLNAK